MPCRDNGAIQPQPKTPQNSVKKYLNRPLLALFVCASAISAAVSTAQAGVTFYSERNFAGTASQNFEVGTYTTAQMAAKGCPDNWIDSFTWTYPGWGSHSVIMYDDNNFSGPFRVYAIRSKTSPKDVTSSVKIQTGVPVGYTYASAGTGLTEFQAGYLFGDWIQMHRNDMVELRSSGSTSRYIVRYETEYWKGSGNIVQPLVQVLAGQNVLISTSGTSDKGTCTGTGFPWEATYELRNNGRVRWTNTESGCAYNLAFRST